MKREMLPRQDHAVDDHYLLYRLAHHHLVESTSFAQVRIIELVDDMRFCALKLELWVFAILQNKRILRRHRVIWLPWRFLNIQQLLYNRGMFLPLSDHEQHRTHEPNLMPKKRIPYVVKIVNFAPIISLFQSFLALGSNDLGREYCALEVNGICYVDFAEIDKVMNADEVQDALAHEVYVEVVFSEEVLVATGGAPVSCVEVGADLLAADYANVLGENGVHHVWVVHTRGSSLRLLGGFLDVGPKVECDDVSHSRDSFIRPSSPREGFISGKDLRDEAECMHSLEDIFLHAIIALILTGHAVVVASEVAHLQCVLPHFELLEQLCHFGLVRPAEDLLLEGFMIGQSILEPLVLLLKVLDGGNEIEVGEIAVILLLLFFGLGLVELLLLLLLHDKRNIIIWWIQQCISDGMKGIEGGKQRDFVEDFGVMFCCYQRGFF